MLDWQRESNINQKLNRNLVNKTIMNDKVGFRFSRIHLQKDKRDQIDWLTWMQTTVAIVGAKSS